MATDARHNGGQQTRSRSSGWLAALSHPTRGLDQSQHLQSTSSSGGSHSPVGSPPQATVTTAVNAVNVSRSPGMPTPCLSDAHAHRAGLGLASTRSSTPARDMPTGLSRELAVVGLGHARAVTAARRAPENAVAPSPAVSPDSHGAVKLPMLAKAGQFARKFAMMFSPSHSREQPAVGRVQLHS